MNDDTQPTTPPAASIGTTDAELVAMARVGMDDLELVDHDQLAHLWDGIAAAAFGTDDADVDQTDSAPATGARPPTTTDDHDAVADQRVLAAVPDPVTTGDDGAGPPAPVADLGARRRRAPTAWLTAAAAAIALVAGASWVVTRPTEEPVATFAMDALDDRVATEVDGTIVARDGATVVELDLEALPPLGAGEFYELWLLDLDAGQVVSLGEVDQSTTEVAVDGAIDATSFPTIDVSVEPADGVVTHSGDSLLRGPILASADGS